MKEFYKTVAMVTIFSAIEKVLGFTYRIYLSHTIGSEGIGIYQIVLSVYAVLLTICCSGIPVTVSRLMTKYKANNDNKAFYSVISAGICLAFLIAFPISLIMIFSGNVFAFLFTDSNTLFLFKIIISVLSFNAIYAVLRGVFWGNKDFLPYSVTEVLEELIMMVVGIILIKLSSDIYSGVKGAIVAVLVSYIFSFVTASVLFFIRKNKLVSPTPQFKPLIKSSTPITLMRTANSLITSLVSIILPARLISAGYSTSEALSLYGSAFGMSMPLLFVPSTLIGSFTLVLIPEISSDYYSNNHYSLRRNIEKSVKFAVLISCLFIPIFSVIGEEICLLIFNNYESGKYLAVSSFLMLGMSLSSLTTSILNSVGKELKSLLYYILSAVLMLICIWFLPKFIGIYSLLVGFTFVFYLTTILNLILLKKSCPLPLRYKKFLTLAILLIIPSLLAGVIIKSLATKLFNTLLTTLITGGLTLLFNLALYKICDMSDFSLMKPSLYKRKKKQKLTVEKAL